MALLLTNVNSAKGVTPNLDPGIVGVQVVRLVVDLQVADAAGEALLHLEEVLGVPELS